MVGTDLLNSKQNAVMMKKIFGVLLIAGTMAACNSGEQTADPTDTLSPRDRDTYVVDPTGTRRCPGHGEKVCLLDQRYD